MKMSLICLFGIAVFVGFGESIEEIIWPTVVAGVIAGGVLLSRSGSAVPTFHGHGDTRARAMTHEKRHKRVLNGQGIKVGSFWSNGIRVWEEKEGWAGVTEIDKSAANLARWNALSPAEQAAVYIAGSPSLGSRNDFGCSDDMAAVDARASRGAARRIASKHLGWW